MMDYSSPYASPSEEPDRQRIVIVEDDLTISRTLAISLKARGYAVHAAGDAASATKIISQWQPDAVLLDLGLPDLSGLEVLRSLRRWSDIPVIVVSARHDEAGKINALDEGADDYITKPFSIGELLARIRSNLRRNQKVASESKPTYHTNDGRVEFNLAEQRVLISGSEVHLTPIEWRIINYLVTHHGQLVSKVQLLQAVWGKNYEKETNYLRVYMSGLRQKIEPEPSKPQYLKTELGFGYRLEL